jgi:hypothetical protein
MSAARYQWIRNQTVSLDTTKGKASAMIERDAIAKVIYEQDPHFEGGEYVDAFQVSPGGALSWSQAKARDAEFDLKLTEFAFKCADEILKLSFYD